VPQSFGGPVRTRQVAVGWHGVSVLVSLAMLVCACSASSLGASPTQTSAESAPAAASSSSPAPTQPAVAASPSSTTTSTSAATDSAGGQDPAASPAHLLWSPAVDTPWQWMIDHALDINNPKDMGLTDPNGKTLSTPAPLMYDIDGFFNGQDPKCNIRDKHGVCVTGDNDAVNQLHAMGKKVVCYIDTGVYEGYRPDAYKFPSSVIGSADSGWNGSSWLDIRRTDILFPIMDARIKMCKDKGYDSIEPDEMVNYSNESGFPLTYQDQLTYNRGIAQIAHRYGISIALKDDPEQAADLVDDFDWMLDEQCYEYSECSLLNPFTEAGKAVFDVEYKVAYSTFCADAISRKINAMQMPLNLDGGRWPCS
jgi:hypothetical protein